MAYRDHTLRAETHVKHESAIVRRVGEGKTISHRSTDFSQVSAGNSRRVGVQRAGELQAQKMIVVQVPNPNRLRLLDSRRGLQPVSGPHRSTRNLHRNRGRFGQRTANYHQSTPSRDVDGRGKLQAILATSVVSADENRNRQLQPGPLTFFLLRYAIRHVSCPPNPRS